MPTEKWNWLYRKEKYHIWYITTETERQADALADLKELKVSDTLSISLYNSGKEGVHMRVHWLPSHVTEAAICNFFHHMGTIVHYSEEIVGFLGLSNTKTGVRELTIAISEREKDRLPHRLVISG